jgi:ATP-dependent helicase/nuclease subunit A
LHLLHNVKLESIAILTRSRDWFAYKLCSALNDLQLSAKMQHHASVFECPELAAIICFLAIIDYQKNDIAMATVLKSQFYDLSDQQLSTIVSTCKCSSFVESCQNYASSQKNDDLSKKLTQFFDKLERYSVLKHSLTVCQLAHTIIADHNFTMALQGREDYSLQTMYLYLNDLNSHPYQNDLSRFVQSVFQNPPKIEHEQESTNCITIMTVHGSKGLEFDYLIVANPTATFNIDDTKDKFLLHSDFGLVSKYYDIQNRQTVTNAVYELAKEDISYVSKCEQMRLLYVALTRAKIQLTIFMDSSAKRVSVGHDVTRWSDWIYPALAKSNALVEYLQSDDNSDDVFDLNQENTHKVFGNPDCKLVESIQQCTVSWDISQKVFKSSVTKLLKTEEYEPILFDEQNIEIGLAYHRALQFIDFNLEFEQAYTNLEKYMVGLDKKVLRNAHSKIKSLIGKAKIYRERTFILNASDLNLNTTLIQGMIDLIIVDKGKATIVDYKYTTKGDRMSSYCKQLQIYSEAVKRIIGLDVHSKFVYDIVKGQLIEA